MTEPHLTQTDIAIVGAGPVGVSLALALAGSGHAVTLLEARDQLEVADPRALALSHGTRLILERLGVWAELAPHATPIESIHVSQRGGLGRAVLTAAQARVPALGYVAGYGDLLAALVARLPACGAQVLTGASVAEVRGQEGRLSYRQGESEQTLDAGLVVLSEGGRALPAPLARDKDYAQAAVICTVRTQRPHAGRAYERFTPEGPIALLPSCMDNAVALGSPLPQAGERVGERDGSGEYALVWTTPQARLDERLALSDAEFLVQLQVAFGDRQGRFTACTPRSAFPLRMRLAQEAAVPRVLRIGNAAHALHPVAGQGFNLGVRDAWELARLLLDTPRESLGAPALASAFAAARRNDVRGGSFMTDMLVEAFSNDRPLLAHARGAALALLDLAPPLKTLFARKMMFGAQAW